MTELATRDANSVVALTEDPTGGRLVAWAQAASAANQLARALTTTAFVPAAFKGNVGDATAAILMGDELGLSPLAALRSIYVVHGSPAMYARTMVALALAHGHQIWTEKSTDSEVVVGGRRRGTDHDEKATWTITRAQKAGYTSNKKYGSNPQEMLYAKAAAEVARKVAPDVLAGIPYSIEDLELDDQPVTTVKRNSATTKARRGLQAAPETPEPDLEPASQQHEPSGMDEFTVERITDAQSKKLHALYRDLGMEDREKRLADAAAFVEHPLSSSAELTKDEASRLIGDLEMRLEALQVGDDDEPGGLFGDDQ